MSLDDRKCHFRQFWYTPFYPGCPHPLCQKRPLFEGVKNGADLYGCLMHIEFKSKRDEAVSRPINVSWIEPLTACGLLLRIGDAPSCHHAICYKKGGWG